MIPGEKYAFGTVIGEYRRRLQRLGGQIGIMQTGEGGPESLRSFPCTLAVAPRLVGINLAHASKQFLGIRFLHFWRSGTVFIASPAAGAWNCRSGFTNRIGHVVQEIVYVFLFWISHIMGMNG